MDQGSTRPAMSSDCFIPLLLSFGRPPLTVYLQCNCACPGGWQTAGQHQHEGQGSCLLRFCSCFTGSSFSDLGSAKLGQRPLSQPGGISTNPFMVSAPVHHVVGHGLSGGGDNPSRRGRREMECKPLPYEVLPCPSLG